MENVWVLRALWVGLALIATLLAIWFKKDCPILVTIIDTEEKIRTLLPVLDEMVKEGLIAMSDVEVIKYVHQQTPTSA